MAQIIDDIRNSLRMVGGGIGMTAFFLAGIVAMWHSKNDSENKKNTELSSLYIYSIVSLIFVIEPAYYIYLYNFNPKLLEDNRYLWIVPIVPVLLYGGISAIFSIKEKSRKILYAIVMMVVVIVASAASYTKLDKNTDITLNRSDCEDAYAFICENMHNNGLEYAYVLAEDAVLECARKYDTSLRTLYGKDEYGCEMSVIMSGQPYLSDLMYTDADYIILDKRRYEESENPIHLLVTADYENETYVVYYRIETKEELTEIINNYDETY